MSFPLHDAHVHLADQSLSDRLSEIRSAYDSVNLKQAVVIGTSPDDWENVINLCAADDRFIPAIGLHPWKVNHAPDDWQEQLLGHLDRGVRVIGELGLDQWIEDYDIKGQQKAFIWEMNVAAERNLPTSIHCLKAHEPLLQTLRSIELPDRGFKLHAYNGPVDTIKPLLDMGAYFSFNAGQLKPNAKRLYELMQLVPDDRLLVETDAPDFLPRPELQEFELEAADCRTARNHPANIKAGYRAIAEVRGEALEEFAAKVALNFERYFGL